MQLQEDFLHYVWRFKQFDLQDLKTTDGQPIHVFDFGEYNTDGGADFVNAKIQIDETVWAGNVEIHTQASEWYKHQHQNNRAYDNVILHVVWENDEPIKRKNGHFIPTFELKHRVQLQLKNRYLKLLHEKAWIPCANQINLVSSFTINSWLDRLLIERLEQKTTLIAEALERNNNDWEETFYQMIARHFGLKINVEPFERVAQTLPHTILAKHKSDLFQIESLLFGQAGFLQTDFKDVYPNRLKKEYQFMQHKYGLKPIPKTMWQFLRLRPPSFPTIRLAQFSALVYQSLHLFSKILEAESLQAIEKLLNVEVSEYWQTHYIFDKESTKRKKTLGKSSIQLIVINTIVPTLFLYGQLKGEERFQDRAFQLLEELSAEQNSVIKNWKALNVEVKNAQQSQALLQLKKHYCDQKKCLNCSIGNTLMRLSSTD